MNDDKKLIIFENYNQTKVKLMSLSDTKTNMTVNIEKCRFNKINFKPNKLDL